jgi:aldehyde dehydrogenase
MTVYARPGTEGSLMNFHARYENYIGGEWVAPAQGRYFENPTPVTGQTFCEVARSDETDIERHSMPHTPPHRRGERRRRPSVP